MKGYETNEFEFVKNLLVDGEYILWKGKPEKGRMFALSDLYIIPLSIVFFMMAISNVIETLIDENVVVTDYLFSTVYMLIVLYVLFGRFIHSALIRKYSCYVVTNKKIIRKRFRKIDTLDLNSIPTMDTQIYKNGNGTISFGRVGYYQRRNTITLPESNGKYVLENIADAVKVQDIISRASENLNK